MPNPNITGYVLAGGRSTRMAQDKAFLPFANTTLLEDTLTRLRQVCTEAVILSGDPADTTRQAQLAPHARLVPDRNPNCGPLGGLDAALHDPVTTSVWTLILPVDQPFLPVEILTAWTTATLATDAEASWLTRGPHPEPLPLLLRRTLAAPVTAALHAGSRRLLPTLTAITAALHPHALPDTPESAAWFTNLNTPADLAAAKNLSSPLTP